MRLGEAVTRGHTLGESYTGTYAPMSGITHPHALATRRKVVSRASSAKQGGSLAIPKVSRHSEFIRKIWGVSRYGELLSDMGPVVLARRMDKESNHCTERRKASAGDIHGEAQRKETKSILRSCTAKDTATLKRVSFALDLISGGDLSNCVHKGGEMEPRQLAK
ncbi:hypothetical protein Acr_00g0079110 [Actinidia rufa]|uniref:Uncharacterized protein n=1 Tax=Actinidia rufa TaxID=165716 RepID=A0A7J0DTP0_9ERIC|nr:hypothetical protein Acr_00g0079110 [Actinidia rufa]